MVSAALMLKALRERARPKLTVRAMAEKLGLPLSSYSRYETPSRFKKRFLPMQLSQAIARILADHGVDPDEVLALAGVSDGDALPSLSADQEQLLASFDDLSAPQRKLLLQLAREMATPKPAVADTTFHGPTPAYRPEEQRA